MNIEKKYRAVVYRDQDWSRFTRAYETPELAAIAGENLVKRYKLERPEIIITNKTCNQYCLYSGF